MPQVQCVCLTCQQTFTRYLSQIQAGGGKYCSERCRRERNGLPVSFVCLVCSATFMHIPSAVRQGKGKYCSSTCFRNRPLPSFAERLWPFVVKTDACWLWQGRCNNMGYGLVRRGTETILAHRLAYELTVGPIPPGLRCLHRCDVPLCCNPDHLWIGTMRDNTRDMYAKQRDGKHTHPESIARGDRSGPRVHPEKMARGERHFRAKLTAVQVLEIRRLRAVEQWDYKRLAAHFGVSKAAIENIVYRRCWRHLP